MIRILVVLILFVASCSESGKNASPENSVITSEIDGERLFKNNCASCHKIDKDFTAPPLHGVLERWGGDKKTMYEFIKNPAKSVVENAYARQLFEKWNRTIMPASTLTDGELDAILKYSEGPIQ